MGIVRCRLHPQEVTFNTNWTCSWGLDTPTLCVILSSGSESCCVARKCQCLGSLHLSVVPNYLHYFNWTTECRHQIIGKKQLYLLHNEVGLCKQYMPDVWSRIEAKRSILEVFKHHDIVFVYQILRVKLAVCCTVNTLTPVEMILSSCLPTGSLLHCRWKGVA